MCWSGTEMETRVLQTVPAIPMFAVDFFEEEDQSTECRKNGAFNLPVSTHFCFHLCTSIACCVQIRVFYRENRKFDSSNKYYFIKLCCRFFLVGYGVVCRRAIIQVRTSSCDEGIVCRFKRSSQENHRCWIPRGTWSSQFCKMLC